MFLQAFPRDAVIRAPIWTPRCHSDAQPTPRPRRNAVGSSLSRASATGSRARQDDQATASLAANLALALTDTSSRFAATLALQIVCFTCCSRGSMPTSTGFAGRRCRELECDAGLLPALLRHGAGRLRFNVYDGAPRDTACAHAATALATPPQSRAARFGRRRRRPMHGYEIQSAVRDCSRSRSPPAHCQFLGVSLGYKSRTSAPAPPRRNAPVALPFGRGSLEVDAHSDDAHRCRRLADLGGLDGDLSHEQVERAGASRRPRACRPVVRATWRPSGARSAARGGGTSNHDASASSESRVAPDCSSCMSTMPNRSAGSPAASRASALSRAKSASVQSPWSPRSGKLRGYV